MSEAFTSQKVLIVTIGVASLTAAALMYVIVDRRRRKGQQSARVSAILEQEQATNIITPTMLLPTPAATNSDGGDSVPTSTTDDQDKSSPRKRDSSPVVRFATQQTETAISSNDDDDDHEATPTIAVEPIDDDRLIVDSTSDQHPPIAEPDTTHEASSAPLMMAQPIITAAPPPPANLSCYKNAESPSGTSTNSEGSADSGRATGGPNCSPFDQTNHHNHHNHHHHDHHWRGWPVSEVYGYRYHWLYDFEVPNTLVGLIIGVRGKTIEELSKRADVRILIRPHHTQSRYKTHQLCSIEGPRKNINMCLHMIRFRFPQNRFPDLNLKPILPPTVLDSANNVAANEPTTLTLPSGVPSEASICHIVDPGHFFVQLPTHPTYSSLANLDYYSANIYRSPAGIPVMPKPVAPGVVCIAPTANGWYRAITMQYCEQDDSVIVRLADHGGFLQLPRSELRQIRSDLTSLPMQAIECYLAHVQPIDGTSRWSDAAQAFFSKTCASRIVQIELIGNHKDNNIPFVQIYATDENKQVRRIDQLLRDNGFAKPSDPARMIPVSKC